MSSQIKHLVRKVELLPVENKCDKLLEAETTGKNEL